MLKKYFLIISVENIMVLNIYWILYMSLIVLFNMDALN